MNKRIFANFLFTLSVCTIIACVHKPNLSPESEFTNSEAILLIGIESNYRGGASMTLMLGSYENNKWYAHIPNFNFVQVQTNEGFVIAKLKPTDDASRYTFRNFYSSYISKPGDKAPAFEAIGGKVVYPGTLMLKADGQKISFSDKFEPDKAKKYIEANYPHLLNKLEFKQLSYVIVGN